MTYQDARVAKIVCTLGPSSDTDEKIEALIKNGMDIVRLNFSHGTHETHKSMVLKIRSTAKKLDRTVAILQDLQGPKIRMAELPAEGIELVENEEVVLASSKLGLDISEALPVVYEFIDQDVMVGHTILLADGKQSLYVNRIENKKLYCTVRKAGTIFSKKGVNMPSSDLQIPAMTDKDKKDLELGLELGVDIIALSFVKHERDLTYISERLQTVKVRPKVIAKIEKPQAVERFEEILAVIDGIMVARGDLGVEMPLEDVPQIQKMLIRKTNQAGKNVITATQMLLSMVENSTPTRAEVSDVANAMYDGSDAVMLSDESAAGKYPIEACATMAKIASSTSPYLPRLINQDKIVNIANNTDAALGRSACRLASDVKAIAIIAFTGSGGTARAVAQYHPTCPIIGLSPNIHTARQLNLVWGVIPGFVKFIDNTDALFAAAKEWLIEKEIGSPGDKVVVTAGVPLGITPETNLLHVLRI